MLRKTECLATQPINAASVYRRDIDGLRAVAVLSVLAFHAFPGWVKGGFIGVDIFFVISGYLISGHIFESLEQGRFSLVGFYARRIRRIFPALCLVLVACLAFGWVALLSDEYLQLGKHAAAGAGFISNLVLWQESGYFDNTAATKPLLHLWSLGVEEQFYILWPVLAWAAWRMRVNALAAIVVLAGVSFALNIHFVRSDPVLNFYSPITRFWELLAGAALAQHEREKDGPSSPLSCNIQSVIGSLLLLCGIALTREDAPFPGWWAGLAVLGTVFTISAGPTALINRIVLGTPLFVAIGLISYPLYLWHWPLLSFAKLIESDMPTRSMRIALVISAFVLATATYFLVERPVRFGGHKRLKVACLVATMALVGCTGLWAYSKDGLPDRPTVRNFSVAYPQFVGPLWKYTKNDTCLNRHPFPEAANYRWWFCMASKDAPPTVLLLGNSFANQLYPGLAHHPRLGQHSILSIGTCPPLDVKPGRKDTELDGREPCSDARWYRQQQLIDKIVVENSSLKYIILEGLSPEPTDDYIVRLTRRIDFFVKAGKQVVIFTPHLRKDADIKGCFGRPFKEPSFSCKISLTDREKWDAGFAPFVNRVRQSHPSAKIFDQNPVFCGPSECSLIVDGMPTMRDEYNHLSEYASLKVGELFAKWAEENLPEILYPTTGMTVPTPAR